MIACSHDAKDYHIVCRHVAGSERPPLYVWRYSDDGRLGYNCGFDDHPEGESYVPLCENCGIELLSRWAVPEVEQGYEVWKATASETDWQVGQMRENEA